MLTPPRLIRRLFVAIGALTFIPLMGIVVFLLVGRDLPSRAVAIAIFAALMGTAFLWFWLRARSPLAQGICVLLVTAFALAASLSPDVMRGAYLLWLYPAAVIGFAFRPARAALTIAGLGALIVLVVFAPLAPIVPAGGIPRAIGGTALPALVSLGLAGWASITVAQLLSNNADLHAAREELARLAVEEERARFARDLHDLLGHTLSLIVVKLELANRLLPDRQHPASAELREIEQLARDALKDVREVAGGYRQPTLAAELAGAGVALEAAGIRLTLDKQVSIMPPDLEATCAWTVREGVTNVVRHSGAHACTVRIRQDAGRLAVDIIDDGRGPDSSKPGMGLNGLRERVESRGGSLEWKEAPKRGFQLSAVLPFEATT